MTSGISSKIRNVITKTAAGVRREVQNSINDPALGAAKVMGLVTVASVAYDAHIKGKEAAESVEMLNGASRFFGDYKHYMRSDSNSATIGELKKFRFDTKPYSVYRAVDKVSGYTRGAAGHVANKLPLLGLSVLAMKFKTPGKVAGIILGLNAIKIAALDVLGIGKKRDKLY